MNENQPQGGAASSLGAHSKDGSQAGHPAPDKPATAAAGQPMGKPSPGDQSGSWQQTGAQLAEQARDGAERVASNVRDAAASARDTISTRGGQAVESTGQMVRDQPFMALAVTGIACFAIGMMIGRGRY